VNYTFVELNSFITGLLSAPLRLTRGKFGDSEDKIFHIVSFDTWQDEKLLDQQRDVVVVF
jgi:hypothetical protein